MILNVTTREWISLLELSHKCGSFKTYLHLKISLHCEKMFDCPGQLLERVPTLLLIVG